MGYRCVDDCMRCILNNAVPSRSGAGQVIGVSVKRGSEVLNGNISVIGIVGVADRGCQDILQLNVVVIIKRSQRHGILDRNTVICVIDDLARGLLNPNSLVGARLNNEILHAGKFQCIGSVITDHFFIHIDRAVHMKIGSDIRQIRKEPGIILHRDLIAVDRVVTDYIIIFVLQLTRCGNEIQCIGCNVVYEGVIGCVGTGRWQDPIKSEFKLIAVLHYRVGRSRLPFDFQRSAKLEARAGKVILRSSAARPLWSGSLRDRTVCCGHFDLVRRLSVNLAFLR